MESEALYVRPIYHGQGPRNSRIASGGRTCVCVMGKQIMLHKLPYYLRAENTWPLQLFTVLCKPCIESCEKKGGGVNLRHGIIHLLEKFGHD